MYGFCGRWAPRFAVIAGLLFVVGLYQGLVVAPPDYQMGDSYRIIFIHVPSAWLSMFSYFVMALSAGIGLVWHLKVADITARSIAPLGAIFTFCALVTGSLWGKPTWGTYWVWDARLTSELILLFLFIGYIALHDAIEDPADCGACIGSAGTGRCGEPADHPFLRRMVEHTASGIDHNAS